MPQPHVKVTDASSPAWEASDLAENKDLDKTKGVNLSLPGLEPKCQQGSASSGVCGGESISSPAFRKHPHPLLMAPSILKARNVASLAVVP